MKFVLSAVLAACCLANAAFAQDPAPSQSSRPAKLAAKIEVAAGYTLVGTDPDFATDDQYASVLGDARFSVPLFSGWSTQIDISGAQSFTSDETPLDFENGFAATGHLSFRNGETYLAGIYGGAGQTNADHGFEALNFVVAGVEGQTHSGPTTLYTQLGYANGSSDTNGIDTEAAPKNAFYGRVIIRHFLKDDSFFKVGGTFGNGALDTVGDNDVSFATWHTRYERQVLPTQVPLNLFAEYRGARVSMDHIGDFKSTDHSFLLGGSLRFGGMNNRENNVRGATLAPSDDIFEVISIAGRLIAP
jgi:hypothetical protein